jgi:cytochrome c2
MPLKYPIILALLSFVVTQCSLAQDSLVKDSSVKDNLVKDNLVKDNSGKDNFIVKLQDSSIEKELAQLPTRTISTQNDPIYHRNATYEGYDIQALISWLGKRSGLDLSEAIITFIAADGYRSSTRISELPKRVGVLAYREQSSNNRSFFSDSKHGKKDFNPGPFVLVWEGSYRDADQLPTPWSITEITLGHDSIPKELIPKETSERISNGLRLWREHCLRCHSINKVGGAVGPELNVPVNITEFWPKERLHQMIENSTSLRWGSAMPSFSWLSKQEREALVEYLEVMSRNKICRSAKECGG